MHDREDNFSAISKLVMALPINIDDLINAQTVESVRIEFKQGWNPFNILRTVCAFANDIDEYGGGYIIVGIEERDGAPILPPVGLDQASLDGIQREFFKLCQNNLRENIFPIIEPVLFQEKWIVVIWVTPGEVRPYSASDSPGKNAQMKIFVRHGSVTKEADRDQEIRLREVAAFKHHDDRINPVATMDNLDLGLMLSYLKEVSSQLYDEATKMSFVDLCSKMQITRGPKENLKPLNVGLLLFCQHPEVFFSGCITNLIEFDDESGTKYSEKIFRGPIHVQIRQIMDYLNTNVIKQHTAKERGRAESISFFNYPYQALEEAVVNSLYHRSYENPTPNEIRIYKAPSKLPADRVDSDGRRIEIISYPGPLPPIDENALITKKITARNYRNLKLGDWLKNLRLAEKFATGIPTILSSLAANGSPEPILSTDAERSHFLVIFQIHPDFPIESYAQNSQQHVIALSDQQQQILEMLIVEPLSELEMREIFDPGSSEELDFLLTRKLIAVKGMPSSNIYYVTNEGREALRTSF